MPTIITGNNRKKIDRLHEKLTDACQAAGSIQVADSENRKARQDLILMICDVRKGLEAIGLKHSANDN